MAKIYHQGKSGFDLLTEQKPQYKRPMMDLKSDLTKMKSSGLLYLETQDNKVIGTPIFKVITSDLSVFNNLVTKIAQNKNFKLKVVKPDNTVDYTASSVVFKLYRSGGGFANVIDENGDSIGKVKPKTSQQEDGTTFCLNEGKMPTKMKINKTVGFDFDKSWHNSFEKTFKVVQKEFLKFGKSLSNYNFYRDSDKKKPDFLNLITDQAILPDNKDNWNPTDVWAVLKTKMTELRKPIIELHGKIKNEKANIFTLNKFLEEKFKKKEIIGISLKKIDSGEGSIKTIQVDANFVKKTDYTGVHEKFNFKVDNSYFEIYLKFKSMKKEMPYKFVFRPRGKSGDLAVYGEGREINSGHFDGAISAVLVNKLFPDLSEMLTYIKSQKKVMSTVYDAVKTQTQDMEFKKFVDQKSYVHFNVENLKSNLDDFKVRRGMMLLYFIYQFEKMTDSIKKDKFKQMYLSGKKMNEFSSIHYKVS